jgi:GTP cyclohydrolase I
MTVTIEQAEEAVRTLMRWIGEDPSDRPELAKTPARVAAAWREWTSGYKFTEDGERDEDLEELTLEEILQPLADTSNHDEMVVVTNIPVLSTCEHHLAPIVGIAHVGYIPSGPIVGLSKLPRLVEHFARRLQLQERLTVQIAEALARVEELAPVGVGVIIRAEHFCISTRGVKAHGAVTTTSCLRGALLEEPEARAEFMALCRER